MALANQNNALAQEEFKKYSNYGFLRGIYFQNFLTIIFFKTKYGNIVIKTHSKPSFFIKLLIILGLAKATFSYRDPRDIILSAIDHGERTRKGIDHSNACKNMVTIKDSIPIVKSWTSNWYKWKEFGNVFFIRYEDLMENKLSYLQEMSEYFNLKLKKEQIEEIYLKHEKSKNTSWNFNKGKTERYKTEMNGSDLFLCNQEFKDILEDMNYSI
ncbi:MAG: sulfotransferase domain-containing protein [Xenococcaceae cyanobacterium MO_188.B29]|nr:sulfotransferase domain-containing protein [Xenococcaceae cyanobacterium MO_188.B29]